MKKKEFEQLCVSILRRLHNKKAYVELCKNTWNFENCKGLIKKEAKEVKKEFDLDFKLAGTERMFYKDYNFPNLKLRFMIPYGCGMIDSSYRGFSESENTLLDFSLRRVVKSVTGDIENPEFTFPMSTNLSEFKESLKFILNVNEEIIEIIENETLNKN
ncbi:hypothetical protein LNI90_11505 [Tenacibaculum dicentrarchi]|nr:hypothetical protein [Tenacibaculum dicentrarchi]MCD8450394.1 hypothetical protein [Tenacibaculum dicentrarchi]MCD8452708.1 hypothetical protein [Tenacibaculum dicentrarchi]MCG8829071.1 hypothetical protein [Tenacibaculum dicentrarchi]